MKRKVKPDKESAISKIKGKVFDRQPIITYLKSMQALSKYLVELMEHIQKGGNGGGGLIYLRNSAGKIFDSVSWGLYGEFFNYKTCPRGVSLGNPLLKENWMILGETGLRVLNEQYRYTFDKHDVPYLFGVLGSNSGFEQILNEVAELKGEFNIKDFNQVFYLPFRKRLILAGNSGYPDSYEQVKEFFRNFARAEIKIQNHTPT